jgi:23S rRNA pseudouridine1911/1915/1917 synthase
LSKASEILADRGDAGERIDLVLCRRLTELAGVSRARVQTWIEDGRVTINGNTVHRPSARTAMGDCIRVAVPAGSERRVMQAERIDEFLRILYEDEHLVALDKPAGAIVHPTYKHASGTVMNALLWYAEKWPEGSRPALVGRLDKDTSGVLLASKNAGVHAALQRATASGAGHKEYLTMVYGRVNVARGSIDVPLGVDPADRRRTLAVASGQASLTTFERLARVAAPQAGLALMRCTLGSGRRHQIRAHLASRSWPIVGDPVYGEPRWMQVSDPELANLLRVFPRQALHAHRMVFTHPVTASRVAVVSPLPTDLQALIASAGFSASAAGR